MSPCVWSPLEELNDDTLTDIFSFLPVPAILALRQTSKRMEAISRLRIIWHHACMSQVLSEGIPIAEEHLETLSERELERAVCRALRIGRFWHSNDVQPRELVTFPVGSSTKITDIRFLAGRGGRYILLVSKGMWSVITCWDVGGYEARKIASWCPMNAIFSGFVVNSDPSSEGTLAISVNTGGRQSIVILNIEVDTEEEHAFRKLGAIDHTYIPISLNNSVITFSNESSETIIMDWKTGATALLCSNDEQQDPRYNWCLQVAFSYDSVLVVRAGGIELFMMPQLVLGSKPEPLHPVARHSFGWINGVAVSPQRHLARPPTLPAPLLILLRAESDDLWAADDHILDLYVLHPNPTYATAGGAPYVFPPVSAHWSSPATRGTLRCTKVVLGAHGTAVWTQPAPPQTVDLTAFDVHASPTQAPPPAVHNPREALTGALFAEEEGGKDRQYARTIWTHGLENGSWTAFDHDEVAGRIALSSSQGNITVLELGV